MKKKREDSIITLDDYQTFQYMLAPPSIAKHIVNEITSFVFYNVPFVEDEMCSRVSFNYQLLLLLFSTASITHIENE